LKECGFYKMMLPKQWGGREDTPQAFFADQIALAEADMSTAWISGIIAVHAFQLAVMDERAARDVYGEDSDTLVSSSYNPVGGKVAIADDGFMLSGRWGWSSGSEHCSWALLGGIVHGEGYRTFLVPRSDYRIEDTWHVMGLQGTGSNDVVIDKPVFVPNHRTHRRDDGFNCINNQDNPMYNMPWAQTFIRVVNTPAIGALKKALGLFIQSRTEASTDPTKLAGDIETQERVAKVRNIISELETILFANFDEMQTNNWAPTIDQRVLYRYQASIVIEKCIEGIDTLFDVAGGRSVFNGHPIQQIWQDIHIARAHVANSPAAFARNLGATSLGLDNTDFFI
ncbi:MAG: flavin-dependent monooxygenase, partial [Pseudomonadales bacterium]|nr:flavin-dependent monooxygenase [Pseudomonadales bacterium]